MKKPTLILLALILPALLGWGIGAFFGRDPSQPNREIFTEMSESFAAESQAESGVLSGDRVSHMPPEGTIYRGQLTPALAWGEESAALEAIKNPESLKSVAMPKSGEQVARYQRVGEKRYQKYCQSCHGTDGAGNAALTNGGFPKPPNIVSGRATTLSEGELFGLISHGQGKMQPMGGRIPAHDIWAIIYHLRQAQGKGGQ